MPYNEENEQFAPLLVIECRGLEFTGFDPTVCVSLTVHYRNFAHRCDQGPWRCEGLKATKFDFDLEGGEWVDYDEKVR